MSPPPESPFRKRVLQYARKAVTAGAVAGTLAADKPKEPAGYMVVDMMPVPAKCNDSSTLLGAALWNEPERKSVRVVLFIPQGEPLGVETPKDVVGAKFLEMLEDGRLVFAPKAGAKEFRFSVRPVCDAPAFAVEWDVTVTLPDTSPHGMLVDVKRRPRSARDATKGPQPPRKRSGR